MHVNDLNAQMYLSPIYKLLTVIFASVLISGCAAYSNSDSNAQYSLDQAVIFGVVVDAFVLPDGSEDRIRRLNNNYSIKLQKNSRLIDIQRATQLKFRSAQSVDAFFVTQADFLNASDVQHARDSRTGQSDEIGARIAKIHCMSTNKIHR